MLGSFALDWRHQYYLFMLHLVSQLLLWWFLIALHTFLPSISSFPFLTCHYSPAVGDTTPCSSKPVLEIFCYDSGTVPTDWPIVRMRGVRRGHMYYRDGRGSTALPTESFSYPCSKVKARQSNHCQNPWGQLPALIRQSQSYLGHIE